MTTYNEASVGCFGPGSVGAAPGEAAADLLVSEAGPPRVGHCACMSWTALCSSGSSRYATVFSCRVRRAARFGRVASRIVGGAMASSPAHLQGIDVCSSVPPDWWISHPGRTLM